MREPAKGSQDQVFIFFAFYNKNTTAQTQKILDVIAGNRIADLEKQVGALELQNQLQTVVRYPNNTTYSVPSPCFNVGCGCGAM